jgi:protein-L-isoaspartate O-methyltransferase
VTAAPPEIPAALLSQLDEGAFWFCPSGTSSSF